MGTETLNIQLPGYDCYNDPNWTDEALKQCSHKGNYWRCMFCCNEDVCIQLEEPITLDFSTVFSHLTGSTPTYDEAMSNLQTVSSDGLSFTYVDEWPLF